MGSFLFALASGGFGVNAVTDLRGSLDVDIWGRSAGLGTDGDLVIDNGCRMVMVLTVTPLGFTSDDVEAFCGGGCIALDGVLSTRTRFPLGKTGGC
jgi:hypothetical protein